jgi:hypothetical protein
MRKAALWQICGPKVPNSIIAARGKALLLRAGCKICRKKQKRYPLNRKYINKSKWVRGSKYLSLLQNRHRKK